MTSNADAVPQLLTIDELAERLATSTRHLHRLVSEHRIPFLKVGWFLRFDPDAIARWLDSSRQEPEPMALVRRPAPTQPHRPNRRRDDGAVEQSPGVQRSARLDPPGR